MKYIYLLFSSLFLSLVYGQNIDNFETLKSTGELPAKFTTLSSEKYYTDRAKNDNEALDNDFFISTRFFLDQLFLSGKVLFNEPLSNYVRDVAKYTLSSNNDLYNKLEFYVLKSTVANAFCTDQGVIMFTTGLLAQIENEAQLAYIICHEVSHFAKDHARNSYIERKSIVKGNQRFKQIDYDEQIKKLSAYSKNNEFEADAEGVKLYLKTDYAKNEIFSTFNMLLTSHLPFDTSSLDHSFLGCKGHVIPDTYFSDSIFHIDINDNYDDKNSTHPNIKKRKSNVSDHLKDTEFKGDLKFKVSEERFHVIRDLARFELLNLWLNQREYVKVMNGAFTLGSKYKNNKFLDLCLVKSLYGIAKYRNYDRFEEVVSDIDNAEEGFFEMTYLLNALSKPQLSVIAFRNAFEMVLKYPNEQTFQNYFIDLRNELLRNSVIELSDLNLESYGTQSNRIDTSRSDTEYTKQDSLYNNEFHLYWLADLVKNKNDLKKLGDVDTEVGEEIIELNKDKVVVVDPYYKEYYPNGDINFLSSEIKKLNLSNAFQIKYPDIETEVDVLDSKTLNSNDITLYNELGILSQWLNEVILHGDLEMISSVSDQIIHISQSKGTNHFVFSGVLATQERHKLTAVHVLGFLSIAAIPIVTYDLIKKNNRFELFIISLNASDDNIELIRIDDIDFANSEMIIKLCVYDALHAIKNQ